MSAGTPDGLLHWFRNPSKGFDHKFVLSYNNNDSDPSKGISSPANKAWEAAMDKVRRYRALGSLCRQQAAYNPDQSWYLLGQAERWEHMAEEELAAHFKACSVSSDAAKVETTLTSNAAGWSKTAAA
jgi:hypothetical protein